LKDEKLEGLFVAEIYQIHYPMEFCFTQVVVSDAGLLNDAG
jgi:hypothetical protein